MLSMFSPPFSAISSYLLPALKENVSYVLSAEQKRRLVITAIAIGVLSALVLIYSYCSRSSLKISQTQNLPQPYQEKFDFSGISYKYKGTIIDNHFEGELQITLYYEGKDATTVYHYEGTIENGKPNGMGKLSDFSTQIVKQGHFKEGLLDGTGAITIKDILRRSGLFKNGILKEGTTFNEKGEKQ